MLPDPLGSALDVIDELRAQLWEARIALVAAMSMEARIARLEAAHRLSPTPVLTRESSSGDMATFTPLRPRQRWEERILRILSKGPMFAADIARTVFGLNQVPPREARCVYAALRRLRHQGRVTKRSDDRYERTHEEAASRPSSWTEPQRAREEASV